MVGDFVIDTSKLDFLTASLLENEVVDDDGVLPVEEGDAFVEEEEEVKEDDPGSKANVNSKKSKLLGVQTLESNLIEVTKENIGKYTLEDVVMPLIGYKSKLPPN